jgi:hypothetical protein
MSGYEVNYPAICGFADLTFSVESMHCCWEEEHGDEDEPTSP